MNKFLEIGHQLSQLDRQLAIYKLNLDHAIEDIAGRALAITPDGGWPGKNEGERKTASDKAFAADETIQKLLDLKRVAEDNVISTQAQIDALEDERRALEWTVKATYVMQYAGVALDDIFEVEPEIQPNKEAWKRWEESLAHGGTFHGIEDIVKTGLSDKLDLKLRELTPTEEADLREMLKNTESCQGPLTVVSGHCAGAPVNDENQPAGDIPF